MAKKGRFVYRGEKRTAEGEMRSANSAGRTFDSYIVSDFQAIKVKEGECQYRILPPTWEDEKKWGDSWQIPIYVHYNIGPDNGVYLCRAKMGKGECPMCKARAEAEDGDEADALKVSERRLCWVVDRDNVKAGPQPWPMPASLYKDIATRSIDKKTKELLLIDHPDDGYDLMFSREGNDKRTRYTGVEFDRDSSPLHDKESIQNKWLDFIEEHPLPSILKFYEEEYLEKLLAGKSRKKSEDDDDDDDEDDKSSRRRKRRGDDDDEKPSSRRRSSKEEEEDDDDEDEAPRRRRPSREEEDDGDEDEKPSSRRRSSKEEEEDDDDEDEKPRRRVREDEENLKKVGRGKNKKKEEEEDDNDDEEEEDEKPRSRRGRSSKEEEDDNDPPFEDEPDDDDEEEDETPKKKERLGNLKKRRSGK